MLNQKIKRVKIFAKKFFLPERERVEMKASIKLNSKTYKYKPIHQLRKTNKSLATLLKRSFLKTCDDIYCQKKCKGSQNKWLKSFTKKRKEKLIQQGAISGCRDVIQEFPEYYKNI